MTRLASVAVATPAVEARFLAALEAVLPEVRPIALHEPLFAGNEWNYVKECIDTGWVSSVGKFVDEFERRLAVRPGLFDADLQVCQGRQVARDRVGKLDATVFEVLDVVEARHVDDTSQGKTAQ